MVAIMRPVILSVEVELIVDNWAKWSCQLNGSPTHLQWNGTIWRGPMADFAIAQHQSDQSPISFCRLRHLTTADKREEGTTAVPGDGGWTETKDGKYVIRWSLQWTLITCVTHSHLHRHFVGEQLINWTLPTTSPVIWNALVFAAITLLSYQYIQMETHCVLGYKRLHSQATWSDYTNTGQIGPRRHQSCHSPKTPVSVAAFGALVIAMTACCFPCGQLFGALAACVFIRAYWALDVSQGSLWS